MGRRCCRQSGGVSPSSLSGQDHSIQLLLSATGKDVDVRLALGVGDHMTWNSPAYEIAPAPSDTVPTRRPFRSCAAGLEAQVGVRFRELTSRSVTVSDIEPDLGQTSAQRRCGSRPRLGGGRRVVGLRQ
jgi:hypothetical protein